MNEQRFRFPGCSEQRLWAARWCLFEFPEVRNLAHLYGDVVGVFYEGDGQPRQWLALLEEHGHRLEPMSMSEGGPGAPRREQHADTRS